MTKQFKQGLNINQIANNNFINKETCCNINFFLKLTPDIYQKKYFQEIFTRLNVNLVIE